MLPIPLPPPVREGSPELLSQQQVRPPPEGQSRPSKGLIAKVVQSKDLTLPEPSHRKEWDTRKRKRPRKYRGRFLYLYFQCSEIGRVKWHIFEECLCRGSKLKLDADEKPTFH